MKKYIPFAAISSLVLVCLLLVGLAMQPSLLRVERNLLIPARPEAIFAVIGDFQQWHRFSPWDKKDLEQTKTISAVSVGVGANYRWHSKNPDVGSGTMTIAEQDPPLALTIQLNFEEPFAKTYRTGFTLEQRGQNTNVIWWMEGQMDLLDKLAALGIDFDAMLGGDFQVGLSNLAQTLVIAQPPPAPPEAQPAPLVEVIK